MIEYKTASADSVIVYFGNAISRANIDIVLNNYLHLKHMKIEGIIDIIPSYTTILFHYDLKIFDESSIIALLKQHISLDIQIVKEEGRLVEVPIYYDEEVGFDLGRISELSNLSVEEIIDIHSSTEYLVYTIGFLPGFAYLGEVDKRIATPRLTSPRTKIPKGSLGIADNQSAIYPVQSPGGWNIIGRTYLDMFDKNLDGFSYLNVGDRVKFVRISREEFLKNGGVI
ncbi:MAG: 5-oxoprolinase subunit PxpB [Sulfurospirillaceae bacterium]|nr:5-oxoprolinase subunit PxpB [Sulfurospirillaceae bacterium]